LLVVNVGERLWEFQNNESLVGVEKYDEAPGLLS
jgi:hypothetical protein